ncbi:MAG: metallo-mystery pair system four-Cys motif protein [Cyanobacteria bacterium SBLK]|nr:metallo-mystery pair system four-Cys motif protein [Cyanobacteria bacterium SBLK]
MQSKLSLFSLTLLLSFLGIFTEGLLSAPSAKARDDRSITLRFQGRVGDRIFECGTSYPNLGTQNTAVRFSDFRFYVSEIALRDSDNNLVPLTLTQDEKWQYQNVALLDFEDKSASCSNGTTPTRDIVIGTVPEGNYTGIQFVLGVPVSLNHEDATLASSPLNLTSLWWNWRGGYKFMRVDLMVGEMASKGGTHGGGHHHHNNAFGIHLGSTGCGTLAADIQPSSCTNPNRSTVVFLDFDPDKNIIVADLAALLENTNLTVNQPNTPSGCMSSPEDGDCLGIMKNLGLPFNDNLESQSTFFRVE